jgi:hypothetical protein
VNVRPYRESDRQILIEIYQRANHGQKLPKSLRGFQVVTDDKDVPLMAAGARLVPEMTLICPKGGETHPLVKLKGIAMLHNCLKDILVARGHNEAIASVPPHLVAYQRHLKRHFGWRESWKTFRIEKAKGDA